MARKKTKRKSVKSGKKEYNDPVLKDLINF